jgi:hypothetical protein
LGIAASVAYFIPERDQSNNVAASKEPPSDKMPLRLMP